MRHHSRGFTLLELVFAIFLMGVLSAVAIPALDSVVSGTTSSAANVSLSSIAASARTQAANLGHAVPSASDVENSVISASYTYVTSSYATPAGSTGPHVVSIDVTDSSTTTPPADGLALFSADGTCSMTLVSDAAIRSWDVAGLVPSDCTGTAALSGPQASTTTTTAPTTTTTVASTTTTVASSTTTTTVAAPTVPGAPTSPAATSNANATSAVSFTPPASNGGSTITGYLVRQAASPYSLWVSSSLSVACSSSPCHVTSLVNGTSYEFEVAAVNAVGTGAWSTATAPATPATTPAAPTGVVATYVAGTTSASLSWTAPASNGGSVVTSYHALSSPGALSCSSSGSPPATSCSVSSLVPGTTYTFTVTATNALGTSPTSSPSSPITVATVPAQPTSLAATPANASASLSFTAPADGGATITGYVAQYAVSPYSSWSTATVSPACSSSPCVVTGLTNGTAYEFEIAAVNAAGTGPWSSASTAVTPAGAPGAPTAVVATGADFAASLSWTAPASNGASITGYTVTASPGGATCTSTSTSCTYGSVLAVATGGTSYTFTVTATNSAGVSASSSASNAVSPTISYVVTLVGGGGGASATGPGAGGGGVSQSTGSLTPGTALPVAVGAPGSGPGSNGSASSFATFTAAGGTAATTAASGASGSPSSFPGGSSTTDGFGGGGGAGAAGSNGTGTTTATGTGGSGGAGLAESTSSVATYGCGGAGYGTNANGGLAAGCMPGSVGLGQGVTAPATAGLVTIAVPTTYTGTPAYGAQSPSVVVVGSTTYYTFTTAGSTTIDF